MNIGAILIGLAILLIAIPWVAGPFRKGRSQAEVQDVGGAVDLGQDRVEVLTALRDLDFDYQTGKVAEVDYTLLRDRLLAEAAQVLQLERQKEQEIEDLIRAHREAESQPGACPDCNHPVWPSDRFCPHCGKLVESTCSECGVPIQPFHRFCPSCGTRQAPQSDPAPSAN